jgi:2-methylfumaryl-CoA isomerase
MSDGILAGLRVIEAAAFVAAPLGGMTLAQMGADVIRIDPPGGGIDYRRWPVTSDNTSLFWCGLNKAKRSVCIDFTKPAGRELAMALISAPGDEAGILLTNFPPRGPLDYEKLRAKREDLIQLTIQGDRHGGSAVDYTVNPRTGLPYLTGPVSTPDPVNHVLPAWDLLTGQMAATGLLAAERHRRRTGQGQHIKLALEDVALAMVSNLGFTAEAELGHERERVGNFLYGAFGGEFRCAGGERLLVIGLTKKQWSALRDSLSLNTELAALGRALQLDLDLEGNRYRAREQIAALFAARIGEQSLEQMAAAFERHGVCWSRYQTVGELVAHDPAFSDQNPLFATVGQPPVGRLRIPTIPLDFGRGGRLRPLPAPLLGEHTAPVLRELLGLGKADIQRLEQDGVINVARSASESALDRPL